MLRKAKVKNRGPKPQDQAWTVAGRLDESLRSFRSLLDPEARSIPVRAPKLNAV